MYSLHSWFIHCCTHTLHTFVDFRCAFVWTSRSDITWRPPGTAGRASESIRRFLCLGTAGPICLSLPRQARTENRQENCALAAVCDRNVQRAEHAKKIRTEIDHQLIIIIVFVKTSRSPWFCFGGVATEEGVKSATMNSETFLKRKSSQPHERRVMAHRIALLFMC